MAFYRFLITDGNRQSFGAAHQDRQLSGPGDRGIKEIRLEHRIVLGQDRDNYRWILAALRAVDRDGIGGQ
jgi:hypothetical protein